MVVLDAAVIGEVGDAATIGELSLPRRKIKKISEELSSCGNLTRIDLSGNLLSNVEALACLKGLKWLSLSGNKLTSLKGLEGLKGLAVLNCSKNEITSTETFQRLKELRALILNDNQISSLGTFDDLVNLDTLVLSQNPISSLGCSLSNLTSLKKLSLSHCEIKHLGTSLVNCLALEELRLAHNHLKKLPQELELNSRLRIVDVGHNNIKAFKSIKVLKKLPSLTNLSLKGNPLREDPSYTENVKTLAPSLQTFDGLPTSGNNSKPKHRKKRKATAEENSKAPVPSATDDGGNRASDVNEARPFLEIVAASAGASADDAAKEDKDGFGEQKKKRKALKEDSKVISIIEGDGKHSRKKHKRQKASFAPDAIALEVPEIGCGGVSSWD